MTSYTVDVAYNTSEANTYTIRAATWQNAALLAVRDAINDGCTDLQFALVYDDLNKPHVGELKLTFQ